jgi:mannose-1-phosphate guanylyltransferase
MIHALIMAGGSGTRFWPLSTESMPKQFLAIGGKKPLLRVTAERILPMCGWEGLLIGASKKHVPAIRRILPELPKNNIILEPRPRNTAPAIALAAEEVAHRDKDGIMIVLPSDHIIRPAGAFRKVMRAACKQAKTGALVTLGIVPTHPETGFGYIRAGRRLGLLGGSEVFEVECFTEKPNLNIAKSYLKSGEYYWNSGMFIFQAQAILEECALHMPALARGLKNIRATKKQDRAKKLKGLFDRIDGISIDYGVMEKSDRINVIPCDVFWSDVGSWAALPEVSPVDRAGNFTRGDVLAINSRNCVIRSEKRLIACVGVEDLVIVETPDAVMVCPKDSTQKVKKIVEELRYRKRNDVL